PAPLAWQEFTLPGGDASVLVPGRPEPMPGPVADGGGVQTKKYSLKLQGGRLNFILASVDAPEEALRVISFDQFCAGERDQVVQAMRGRVANETPITLNGHPGKEFQVLPGDHSGMLIERIYMVRRPGSLRFYLVAVAGKDIKPESQEARKFFESFRIEGPPAAAQPAA